MTAKCGFCTSNCKKEEGLVCSLCDAQFHASCALKNMPSLNKRMVELLNKNKGATFIYGCKKCGEGKAVYNFTAKLESLETQIQDLTTLIKNDIVLQLNGIKLELEKSMAHNKSFETATSDKLLKLEMENNSIRKQLNRADIIVSGLPSYISNEELYSTAGSIAKICGVALLDYDLNVCTWIRNKSCVLIKFNNVRKRDAIMKHYRSTYDLKLCQILSTDIESRVYLSDHLTPAADKLRFSCRKILKSGEIKKFRLQNRDIPRAVVTFNDGKEMTLTITEMDEVFTRSGVQAVPTNIENKN